MTITVDYSYSEFKSQARTLSPSNLGYSSKSGWLITGEVVEDYYEWVNDFVALHPVHGMIEGNFEIEVKASSQEALDHFLSFHCYEEWDYYDI